LICGRKRWFRMMSPKGKDSRYKKRHTPAKSVSITSCGERPPCTQKNFPSTSAATGREQKERRQASYTASEYLCRPGYSLSTTTEKKKLWGLQTFALESEVFGEMAALVVPSKHDYPSRRVDFEGVEV
jgi:hypothetical protein